MVETVAVAAVVAVVAQALSGLPQTIHGNKGRKKEMTQWEVFLLQFVFQVLMANTYGNELPDPNLCNGLEITCGLVKWMWILT